MSELSNLSPSAIWSWFEAITRIPRPSKHEERIVSFLVDFARSHGLDFRTDKVGNVVILKPASPSMEGHPTVVLQNHVDMVCEKNADATNDSGQPFDFFRDAIRPFVSPDGWVRARGTTLGADNGLGMAAVLALLLDPQAVHGPLEALFTVDEETGLSGAFGLGDGMLTGTYLINLDSEDEGEIFIGCAGGVDTQAFLDFTFEPAPPAHRFFELSVGGLLGGHSGDDIEKGRGNSNKILARALSAGLDLSLRLSSIDGGNLRNAIPREAHAVVAVPAARAADFTHTIESLASDVRSELQYTDPGVTLAIKDLAIEEAPISLQVIDTQTTARLVSALFGVPNGVQAMSFAVADLVETSTNLASVKIANNQIVVTTSQRSSVESSKRATAASVGAVFSLAGARVTHSEGYPGWTPNPDSHLLAVTQKAYAQLFNTSPKILAIHAGLECGLFLEKFPNLDMVSFGPTILGAHSPDERIEISTVDKFWQLLLSVLKEL